MVRRRHPDRFTHRFHVTLYLFAMRNLLFALLLFTSCASANFEGQLSDLTVVDGLATFKLDGKSFENVQLLSESASRMTELQGQRVGLRMQGGEITEVISIAPESFYRGTLVVVVVTLVLGILLSQLPEKYTNPSATIYGGNYGGESWWSNKL